MKFPAYILSFLLCLVFLDIVLHTSLIGKVSPNELYPDIGRGRRQNHTFTFLEEGFSIIKLNEQRTIGNTVKLDSSYKIALLGDSFVESFQVFERHHFKTIAEQNINANANNKVELINIGHSGFTLSDMYIYHKKIAKSLNVDEVFYLIYNADLRTNQADRLRAKLIYNDSLQIIVNPAYRNKKQLVKQVVLQNSTLISSLNYGFKRLKREKLKKLLFPEYIKPPKPIHHEFSNTKSVLPINYQIIKILHKEKVTFINIDQNPIDKHFVDSLNFYGINYFSLDSVLENMLLNKQDPYYWKATDTRGHWNQSAHKEIGDFLANIIKANQNLPN